MKKLVVFYSLEGNTKLIAEHIAEKVHAEILELKPKNEAKPKGLMKYLWGGKQLIMKKQPELMPLDKNASEYDFLFIGTPVWAWSYAPALSAFFSSVKIENKKIALFCCHGGGKGRIFDKMKQALKNNEFIGEIDFQDPLKKNTDENLQKAINWAEQIISCTAA